MVKRGGDPIERKSNKKPRELKVLGPILVEPMYDPIAPCYPLSEVAEEDDHFQPRNQPRNLWKNEQEDDHSEPRNQWGNGQEDDHSEPRNQWGNGQEHDHYEWHTEASEEEESNEYYSPTSPSYISKEDEEEKELHSEPNAYDKIDYEVSHPSMVPRCTVALEYYNKKNHTDYQVVDALFHNGLICADGLYIHCNFTAKKSGDDNEWLFFAELLRSQNLPATLTATYCCILRGKTKTGCTECEKVLHPTRGFRKGHVEYGDWFYKGPTLRPRPEKEPKHSALAGRRNKK